tara:strand:- start:5006 stop:6472 length:1467 start_codon:yes stop_codon:yes gene_type:complete
MNTLYLHVGIPKTGTTSIQNFLNINKEILFNDSFIFYSHEKNGNFSSLPFIFSDSEKLDWIKDHNGIFSEEKKGMYKEKILTNLINTISKFRDHDFIISSEHIFMIYDENDSLERLAKFLKEHFHEIKIIIYIRNQLEYMISSISTEIESSYLSKKEIKVDDIIQKFYTPKNCHDLFYSTSISIFEDIFGKENIILNLFCLSGIDNNNLYRSFLNNLGLDDHSKYSHPKNLNSFKSLEIIKSKILLNNILKDTNIDKNLLNKANISVENISNTISKEIGHLSSNKKISVSNNIYNLWEDTFLISNKKINISYFKNKNELFEENYMVNEFVSDDEFKEQFKSDLALEIKDKINDISNTITSINDSSDMYNDNLWFFDKGAKNYDVTNYNGIYNDGWASKLSKIDFKIHQQVESLEIHIRNPKNLNGDISLDIYGTKKDFKISNKDEILSINIKIDSSHKVNLIMRSTLDSSTFNDERELSFVVTKIIFK